MGSRLRGVGFALSISLGMGRREAKGGTVGKALRVLAVYSLPDRVSPLNLRRERYGMKRLVDELRQSGRGAVELAGDCSMGRHAKDVEGGVAAGWGMGCDSFVGAWARGEVGAGG